MFVDYATLRVKAGKGGDGCVSFRREKFIPKGGPDGGDGGKGGDVIFQVDPNRTTLLDFRYTKHYEADAGKPGSGNRMSGKGGADIVIPVPPGTVIHDKITGEILADMTDAGQRWIAAKGGDGGRGNTHFATSVNQAPRKATPGWAAEQRELILELKSIADVGLVGKPNAGKSTLLSTISAARPKIADYPFTTLEPNLGIVRIAEFTGFIVADIPGLIEGAADGKGLGIRFLRHIERTRLLLYLIPADSEDPNLELSMLQNEIEKYSPELAKKPSIVARSKADLINDETIPFQSEIDFSAVTRLNLDELTSLVWHRLEAMPKPPVAESEDDNY